MKLILRSCGLVLLVSLLSSCGSPHKEYYDAGLYKTEEYRDGIPPRPHYQFGYGPWGADPQYDYYQGYDARTDVFIWEDNSLFPGRR